MPTTNIDGAHVFPEDVGTDAPGSYEQPTSAGHYGGLVRHDELLDYVADGMSLNPDYGNSALDITSGTAFLLVDDEVLVQEERGGDFTSEWQSGIGVVINAPEVTNIDLSSGTLNHVFLACDMNQGDGAYYETNTTDEQPDDPYVKIGEVDTDAEEVDPLSENRTVGFADPDSVEQNTDDIDTLDSRVSNAEGDIGGLESKTSGLSSDGAEASFVTASIQDEAGEYGDLNLYNNREFDGLQGHYFTTGTEHLPTIIRNSTVNTLVADDGDVSIPNGDLSEQGDRVATREYVGARSWVLDEGESVPSEADEGDIIVRIDDS